eukprot:Hpha_TRINITY_DN23429_c0_g1::TRINITY_DN23429_c0_g1_i1::g.113929::m.113929
MSAQIAAPQIAAGVVICLVLYLTVSSSVSSPTPTPCPAPPKCEDCTAAVAAAEHRWRREREAASPPLPPPPPLPRNVVELQRELQDATDRLARAEMRAQRAEDRADREAIRSAKRQDPHFPGSIAWAAAAFQGDKRGPLLAPGLSRAQLLALVRLSDESLRHRLRSAAATQLEGVWKKQGGEVVLRVFTSVVAPYNLRLEVQGRTVGPERLRLRTTLHATGDGFTIHWTEAGERFASWGDDGVSRMQLYPSGLLLENGGAGEFTRVADDPASTDPSFLPPPPKRRWKLRAAADIDPQGAEA